MNKLTEQYLRWKIAHNDRLAQALNKTPLDEPKVNEPLAALCREVAAEGIVLLKNEGVLPLNKEETVSFFGRVQQDYFYVGYGSGGDVIAPYRTSPLAALKARTDIRYNKELAAQYERWCAEHVPFEGIWGKWPTYFEEMPLTDEEISAAAACSSTAVVFIGRAMGEAQDNTAKPGGYYLTAEEQKLIDRVTAVFPQTVAVIDAGNQIDLSWAERCGDKLAGLVYVWQGGMESGNAVVDVLYGDVCPSGKLTDTIARNYKDYPAARNFGGKDNTYEEDIFVGYRYFETFARDKVLYPFGFGLSYTSFAVRSTFSVLEDSCAVTVTVTNTGACAGKETVQLYLNPPQGLLGKSSRSLISAGKTPLLQPGESCMVELWASFDACASYDDTGVTGHKSCYVMEAGEYGLYLGTDVRSAGRLGSFYMEELRVVKELKEQCAPQKPMRRFTVKQLGGKLFPLPVLLPAGENKRGRDVIDHLPEAIVMTGDRGIKLADVKSGAATMEEFIAQLDAAELEAISLGEGPMDSHFGPKGNAGMLGGTRESLRAKGIPTVITTDGPSGVRVKYHASLLPCGTALACTWNDVLLEKLGRVYGEEVKALGSDMILAPGLNIHRDPLCGRNFEYFSEDPFISGKIAAALVRGIQHSGKSACPKHFACNNQEYNRHSSDSRVSERALREIYLKGFEICVKEAKPLTIMTSYNKVNGVWSHYNYELVQNILRGEWGYEGLVITDWWMQHAADPDFPNVQNNAYRVRGGVDVLMPGTIASHNDGVDRSIAESLRKGNGLTIGELQRTAEHVLRLAMKVK